MFTQLDWEHHSFWSVSIYHSTNSKETEIIYQSKFKLLTVRYLNAALGPTQQLPSLLQLLHSLPCFIIKDMFLSMCELTAAELPHLVI